MNTRNEDNQGTNNSEFKQWLAFKDSLFGYPKFVEVNLERDTPYCRVVVQVPLSKKGKNDKSLSERMNLFVHDKNAILLLHKYANDINRISEEVSEKMNNGEVIHDPNQDTQYLKVGIAFRAGALSTSAYIIEHGDRAGEPACSIDGNLNAMSYLMVAGKVVYGKNRTVSDAETEGKSSDSTSSSAQQSSHKKSNTPAKSGANRRHKPAKTAA